MHIFILLLITMYWLPTIVAAVRHSPNAVAVAVLNFFLGWTIFGWIIALIWALAAKPLPPQVVIHVDGGSATISSNPRV